MAVLVKHVVGCGLGVSGVAGLLHGDSSCWRRVSGCGGGLKVSRVSKLEV